MSGDCANNQEPGRIGKMKACVISCVFPPEPLTAGSTSDSLARALVKQGHAVTVIANYPSRPYGQTFPGFRRRLFTQHETKDGFKLVRCFGTVSRSSTLLSRFAENLSFGCNAGLCLACAPRPDAIYINVWPLVSQGILSWVAKLRRIPVVLSIQDVYPESLVSLKKLRAGTRIAKLLRWLDESIALNASAVIVISKTVENIYLHDRGIARGKVHLIANWKTAENLPPAETAQIKRKEWDVEPGVILLVFAGNVAAACGIENVISAFSALSDDSPVQLVIAGSGNALPSCREIADRNPSGKVQFTGAFQVQDTLSILSGGDILLLPTQGSQSLVSMPSKLISYMMSARPILAIACLESDLASVIRESGCGWVIPPGDSDGLSRQLEVIANLERPELARMGALGREYALENFSTEACLPKLVAVVESVGRS